jgi:hypothetical protein
MMEKFKTNQEKYKNIQKQKTNTNNENQIGKH